MLTLAFDTSSKTAAVAVLRDETVLCDTVINTGRNHSEVLLPAIDDALRLVGIKMSEIDLLACTLGPGSFTGLRIGVSTLKGLMMATGKPAAGVSSLEALALNVGPTDKMIGAVLDAGRGQVYLSYYRHCQDGSLIRLTDEKALAPDQIENRDQQDVIYVGDGAIKYADVVGRNSPDKRSGACLDRQYIHASSVGLLGLRKFYAQDLLHPGTCRPVYLRSADAVPAKPAFHEEKKRLFDENPP